MAQLPCPYLKGEVELTVERERHIAQRHPDLLPGHYELTAATGSSPHISPAAWRKEKRNGSKTDLQV